MNDMDKNIPEGIFCYNYTGNLIIINHPEKFGEYILLPEIKMCPYWEQHGQDAYCSHMNHYSKVGSEDMLWNKMKVCIGEITLMDMIEQEKDYPKKQLFLAYKKSKKSKEFLYSIKNILTTFNYKYFTYDGITYTLPKNNS